MAITLANEEAKSRNISPFSTIGTLADSTPSLQEERKSEWTDIDRHLAVSGLTVLNHSREPFRKEEIT